VLRVNVGQNSSGAMAATLAQQITFGGGQNKFFFMPTVAANDAQRTVVIFQRSDADTFVASAWALKAATASTYSSATTLEPGNCSRPSSDDKPVRVGDYGGAQVNPADGSSFWITGERAAYWPPGTQERCVWASTVVNVN